MKLFLGYKGKKYINGKWNPPAFKEVPFYYQLWCYKDKNVLYKVPFRYKLFGIIDSLKHWYWWNFKRK